MVEPVTINLQHVARDLGLPLPQVQATVELLDEGNTVPFITRYRKDHTGGLDEEQIRRIQEQLRFLRLLAERKQTILRSIESQGKLTERLAKQILGALTTKRLEDLYLPYKPKKQTLATQARSRGLEPLANEILAAAPLCADLDRRAADFVNEDKQVKTAADALLGAGHILAEQFSERAELRQRLREVLQRTGELISTGIAPPAKEKEETKPAPAAKTQEPPAAPIVETTNRPKRPTEAETATVTDVVTVADVLTTTDTTNSIDAGLELPASEADAVLSGESEPVMVHDSIAVHEVVVTEQTIEDVPAFASPHSVEDSEVSVAAQPAPVKLKPAQKAASAKKKGPSAAEKKLTKAQLKRQQIHEKKLKAFSDYFDYREGVRKVPPHRVLAINRGERGRILRVRVEVDMKAAEEAVDELLVPVDHPHADFLRGCAHDSLTRLILPSLERELRREMTDKAELHAVSVFARNLRNLLLQPPIHGSRVLAVDPGYRSGCKLVALDEFGNVLGHGVILLVGKHHRKSKAIETVTDLVDRFSLKVIVIGNGTACRETEDFFAELISGELKDRDLAYVIVNEAGASVYSTSRLGREEFPEYDAILRGAISIGRRLQDPLSELVKIDPARIGVGLYQHDVKAKHLHSSLDEVVESCVNFVAVNVNTASPALLRYVSGLNQLTARRLYEHRIQNGPFRNRRQLKAVSGIGEASFVQAAGFLKIVGGDQPLDTTWIHPESYEVATRLLAEWEYSVEDLTDKAKLAGLSEKIAGVDLASTAERLGVGTLLLGDILTQLSRPGRDPREDLPKPVFKRGVLKIEDLAPGMELHGTVLNVVDFGAFVDIGMHDSGLVHVSQLANQFVRDPHDVVAVGNIVKVWVVGVDKDRRRVSLTMIPPGSKPAEKPDRGGHGRPNEGRPARRGAGGRRSEGSQASSGTPSSGAPAGGPSAGGRTSNRSRKPHQGDRGKGKRFERSERSSYQPKPRPKPVVPITKKMIAGAEPMRTFGDLAQFFQVKKSDGSPSQTPADAVEKKPDNSIPPDETSQQ
ncbi:MAG: RNA-binding transcriptional accessory protein [Pirellulaceae bacterium]|nr:RNA-binding transcriptional accessory protein [Pirellulaceae bacterium]